MCMYLVYTCHTVPNCSFCSQCSHHIQDESETGSNAPAAGPSQEPPKLEPIDVLLGVSTPELIVRCLSESWNILEHSSGFLQASSLLRVWLLWNWPWPPRLNPLTGLLFESTVDSDSCHGHRQKERHMEYKGYLQFKDSAWGVKMPSMWRLTLGWLKLKPSIVTFTGFRFLHSNAFHAHTQNPVRFIIDDCWWAIIRQVQVGTQKLRSKTKR
jgi:hypothetical protein